MQAAARAGDSDFQSTFAAAIGADVAGTTGKTELSSTEKQTPAESKKKSASSGQASETTIPQAKDQSAALAKVVQAAVAPVAPVMVADNRPAAANQAQALSSMTSASDATAGLEATGVQGATVTSAATYGVPVSSAWQQAQPQGLEKAAATAAPAFTPMQNASANRPVAASSMGPAEAFLEKPVERNAATAASSLSTTGVVAGDAQKDGSTAGTQVAQPSAAAQVAAAVSASVPVDAAAAAPAITPVSGAATPDLSGARPIAAPRVSASTGQGVVTSAPSSDGGVASTQRITTDTPALGQTTTGQAATGKVTANQATGQIESVMKSSRQTAVDANVAGSAKTGNDTSAANTLPAFHVVADAPVQSVDAKTLPVPSATANDSSAAATPTDPVNGARQTLVESVARSVPQSASQAASLPVSQSASLSAITPSGMGQVSSTSLPAASFSDAVSRAQGEKATGDNSNGAAVKTKTTSSAVKYAKDGTAVDGEPTSNAAKGVASAVSSTDTQTQGQAQGQAQSHGSETVVVSKEAVASPSLAAMPVTGTPDGSSNPQPGLKEALPAAGVPVPAGSTPQTTSSSDAQAASALSSAQLIQSTHGSEMRLGMKSAEFGDISISTSLNREALSAQISIDHAALGHALSVHLPAIEEKLGNAYGVQAKVELRDAGNSSTPNDSGREPNQSRSSQGWNGSAQAGTSAGLTSALTSSSQASVASTSSRLDIRI
jgi:hypothetical protein